MRVVCFFCVILFETLGFSGQDKKEAILPILREQRFILAVMPFEDKTIDQKYKPLGNQIADQLISEIFNYERFRLIEREKLNAILEELQVQQTDYFKKEVLGKIGNQLGAELLLMGSIAGLSESSEKKSLGFMSKEEFSVSLNLEARMVNLATGEILGISKWNGKEEASKKRALLAVKDSGKTRDDLIQEAVRKAVANMAYEICRNAPEKKLSK